MNAEEFELVFDHEVDRSRQVLVEKAKEYAADGDRMHNFYKAAHLDDETPEQALWGFLKKHIISLADMVKSGDDYPLAVWDEKLGDFLNYGFLLKALVVDQLPEDEKEEFLTVLRDAAVETTEIHSGDGKMIQMIHQHINVSNTPPLQGIGVTQLGRDAHLGNH